MYYTNEASLAGLFMLLLDKDAPVLHPAVKITTTAEKMEAFLPAELLACISPSESGSAKSKGGRPKKNNSKQKKKEKAEKEADIETHADQLSSTGSWRTSSYLPFLYNAYKNAKARREEMADVLRKNPVSILLDAERKAQAVLYKKGAPCFDASRLEEILTDRSCIPVKSPESQDRYIRHIDYYMRKNPEKAFSRAFLAILLAEQCDQIMDLLFPSMEYSAGEEAALMPHADALLQRGLYKEAKPLYQAVMDDLGSPDRAEAALKIGRIYRYHYTSGEKDSEAYALFVKSLELAGSSPLPDTLYELYLCERDGIGTEDHNTGDEKAWDHLLAAAGGGCLSAILEAGGMYYAGNERFRIPMDQEKAADFYRIGAETGDAACETMYGKCLQDMGKTDEAQHWFYRAAKQGNVDASLLLTESDIFRPAEVSVSHAASSAPEQSTPEDSVQEQIGICFLNAKNAMADTFSSSLPAGWKISPLTAFETLFEDTIKENLRAEKVLIFLSDEDSMKNLQDLDRTIGFLEQFPMDNARKRALIGEIHFYLRTEGDDRLAVKMVDSFNSVNELRRTLAGSADSREMPFSYAHKDWFYRIRICNPMRDASQYLLSRAPLFLPSLADRRVQSHVLILGEGEIVLRLIADMLSIFPYTKDGKPLPISVLSEDAEVIRRKLRNRMPEIWARKSPLSCDLNYFSLSKEETTDLFLQGRADGVSEKENTEKKEDLTKELLRKELRRNVDEANYFIVAGNNDAENIETAAFLRGALLASGNDYGTLPLIAAYVRDPLLSRQASHFSVIGEGIGFSWYNNYNLFCFGSDRQLYTFQELESGYMEERSLAVHRSYYGADSEENEQTAADYWCRFYNRDSSHMSALSAIYKAYLAGAVLKDADGYGRRSLESQLAEPIERYLADPQHLEDAALAEHDRWAFFVSTRGWRHASEEQMKHYIEQGNPRQQLYLARLHPCITSWQRLPEVEKEYNAIQKQRNPAWKDKKLIQSDYDIVKATPNLLRQQ